MPEQDIYEITLTLKYFAYDKNDATDQLEQYLTNFQAENLIDQFTIRKIKN